MRFPRTTFALLALAGAAASPALAASGSIQSFSAGALAVTAGGSIDFVVNYSVAPAAESIGGGSNLAPPAPEEGYQYWALNWSSYERETLRSVWLVVGGNSYSELLSLPESTSHSGSLAVTLHFPVAGRFDIGAYGGWEAERAYGYSNESGSRNCHYADPDNALDLQCDWWTYNYAQADDYETSSGDFAPVLLSIDVLAPVPEPRTLALWLAGLGLLAARGRFTRR